MAQAERKNKIFALTKADLGRRFGRGGQSRPGGDGRAAFRDCGRGSASTVCNRRALLVSSRVIAPLRPPHLALPFEVHACQLLASDEAKGRVCLALHLEDVYVVNL